MAVPRRVKVVAYFSALQGTVADNRLECGHKRDRIPCAFLADSHRYEENAIVVRRNFWRIFRFYCTAKCPTIRLCKDNSSVKEAKALKLITGQEAAEMLSIGLQRLYELVRQGVIPHVKIGSRQLRF